MLKVSGSMICTRHGVEDRAYSVLSHPIGIEGIGVNTTIPKRRGDVTLLDEGMVLDRTKAEYRLFGRRHAAVDAQSLCDHLDSLVGPVVGEVIINNLETRLGKEDGSRLREANPKASVAELVKMLEESDVLSGVGITKTVVLEDPKAPIKIETWNPIVRGEKGAAKSFLFSWWCGALTSILGRELELRTVQYDEKASIMKCEIVLRQSA